MRKDKNYFIGWCNTVIGHFSNKRVEFKFIKEIRPCYYWSMLEIFAELNGKIATRLKTISLHLDSFNIRFDSFSNKSVVTMSHGVSIKIERSDLAMQKGLKKNETLRGSAPIVSLFMTNMKRYTGLYVSTNVIQNQVVGVRAPLL